MQKQTFYLAIILSFFISKSLFAGDLTIPNTFTAGTAAVAAEVNDNFSAVEAEVDDNDARIADLENAAVTSLAADQPLRIIRGSIDNTGNISAGAGFSITNNSTGVYTINYDTSFAPRASVTANTWTIDGYIRVSISAADSATIRIFNSAGTLTNAGFHFIAIGN